MSRVKLTKVQIRKLYSLKRKTGLGPQALLRGADDIPEGLNTAIIYTWMRGQTKTARKAHFDYVMRLWQAALPKVKITQSQIIEIQRQVKRTGVSWQSLISNIDPLPHGLDAKMLSRMMTGRVRTVRQDYIDVVISTLQSLPDSQLVDTTNKVYLSHTAHRDRRAFSQADADALLRERECTGISQGEMLKYFYRGQVPDGLTNAMISAWMNTLPKTVPSDLYDWTLKAWKALPDANEK